jgi:hypothetical protein
MGCLMLSGGRDGPLYPRPSEPYPRLTGPELRDEPYELRSSPRPIASGRAGPEDGREGMGENVCQPPRLLLPPSRAELELPMLRSGRDGLLFAGTVERDCPPLFGPDSPKRRNPLFEPLFELLFPGLEISRLFPVGPPSSRRAPEICDCPRSAERGDAFVPRPEKKC